jgi:hypothetical protein
VLAMQGAQSSYCVLPSPLDSTHHSCQCTSPLRASPQGLFLCAAAGTGTPASHLWCTAAKAHTSSAKATEAPLVVPCWYLRFQKHPQNTVKVTHFPQACRGPQQGTATAQRPPGPAHLHGRSGAAAAAPGTCRKEWGGGAHHSRAMTLLLSELGSNRCRMLTM